MIKQMPSLLLVLLMAGILAGAIGCRSSANSTYAPTGSSAFTPPPDAVFAPSPAPPAESSGGSCPHCK